MKHIKEHPDQKTLKGIYDYEDGFLIRKYTTNHKSLIGTKVGYKSTKGYLECKIGKSKYQVHRLIWIWHYGDIPEGMLINHINEIKDDNRIDNLELSTNRYNTSYSKIKNNKIGFTRVRPNGKGWSAAITAPNGKVEHLGTYATKEDAARAYDRKAIEYEGKCARTNFPLDDYADLL